MPEGRTTALEGPKWVKGHARYVEGWLALDPASLEDYYPAQQPGRIALEFAGIRTPVEAVQFATKYGLLHHGPGAAEFREPFGDWIEAIGAVVHILDVYALMRAAADGDADALERLRQADPERETTTLTGQKRQDELVSMANNVLAWKIREGLEKHRVQLGILAATVDQRPGYFMLTAYPSSLLGFIYYDLAMLVTNHLALRYCLDPHCGRIFLATDPRSRYCSAACGNRARVRRSMRKRRTKAAT